MEGAVNVWVPGREEHRDIREAVHEIPGCWDVGGGGCLAAILCCG